ncbi:MAG: AMP-binding protein [Rhodobiaceae bacterium]|nr:AMP-binding protein [Rhodobiaceae bacterium]MCC0054517.1 AMP-binding protein [Rhodobiaceae bacterium]
MNSESGTRPPVAEWLPGGEPAPGRIARPKLRNRDDIKAIEQFSFEELLAGDTILENLEAAAAIDPARPAIKHLLSADPGVDPRVITYGELIGRIHAAASAFEQAAAGEKPSVAVIMPMVPEGLIATWAAASIGVGIPVNPFLELGQAAAIMNAARANVLVIASSALGPGLWDRVAPEDFMAAVPTLKRVFVVGGDDPANDFDAALKERAQSGAPFTRVTDPHADANYLATGGTTGSIKLVRMTHRGQLVNAWLVGALSGDPSTNAVIGHAMPNFHVGGLVNLALRTLIYGQTLLTLTANGFRDQGIIANFWDIARRHNMTFVLSTPATAAALLAANADSSGHAITTYHCGGSTIPVALSDAVFARFGIRLRETWGMTEVHGTVSGHPVGMEPMVGSVGIQLPKQPVRAFILDDENNFVRICEPGERGVLAISGEGVAKGYVDPKYNKDFLIGNTPDGKPWGSTGDLGMVDRDGYIWIFGRAKDVIIRGGHNIDAKMIEEVLVQHPAVQLAAAIGRPDPAKGELPVAYVQLKQGASVSADELMDLCRREVQERAAVPIAISIVDALPVTPVGKIFKPELRRMIIAEVAGEVADSVLGARRACNIAVDMTGSRPTAAVKVDGAADAALADQLAGAFRSYEFNTRIDFSA